MTLFKKIIGKGVSDTIDSIGNAIDKIDNSEVKRELEYKYQKLLVSLELRLLESRVKIFEAESKGNWLQKSWRPVLMFACILILLYNYFFVPIFNLTPAKLDNNIWDIIKIGLGVYLPLRTVEKFAPQLNVFKRRKDKKT